MKADRQPRANRTPGASTSAAKVGQRTGIKVRLGKWVWIGGREQRWGRWSEIAAQVAKAHERWRMKQALRGVRVLDQGEMIEAQINEQLKRRTK